MLTSGDRQDSTYHGEIQAGIDDILSNVRIYVGSARKGWALFTAQSVVSYTPGLTNSVIPNGLRWTWFRCRKRKKNQWVVLFPMPDSERIVSSSPATWGKAQMSEKEWIFKFPQEIFFRKQNWKKSSWTSKMLTLTHPPYDSLEVEAKECELPWLEVSVTSGPHSNL